MRLHRLQMRARRLFAGDMVDVGLCDTEPAHFFWTTASASTICFDWGEVVGV